MGTRSITTVQSRWDSEGEYKVHATVYRHYDGYLSGHGAWLADFLKMIRVKNGISGDWDKARDVNGPGRLAARLVVDMYDNDLEPDLMPHNTDCGQEYHYQISVEFGVDWEGAGAPVSVAVFDGPIVFFGCGGDECTNKIFDGSVEEFGEFVNSQVSN